jgi:hypothetical protein
MYVLWVLIVYFPLLILLSLGYVSTTGDSPNNISGCTVDSLVDCSMYFKDVSSFG